MPGLLRVLLSSLLRLGKYFGTSPEIWLDLQSDYELRAARQTTWTRVEPLESPALAQTLG